MSHQFEDTSVKGNQAVRSPLYHTYYMTILDSEYFKDLIRIVPSQFIVCQSFAEKFKYFFFKDDEIRDYLFHAISYQKVGLNQNLPAEFNLEFKYSTLNR